MLRFSQGVCRVVGLLSHMVVLLLVFKEISMVAVSIYIPTNGARGFPFFHYPLWHLLFVAVFMMAILTSVR